ncbi:MAG TPA: ABC transporter substrate-binding protein [Rhizobiaceae bacterium]|nr:ABC transporter substrate-binding protein [Rhizobiaceae bacterium]
MKRLLSSRKMPGVLANGLRSGLLCAALFALPLIQAAQAAETKPVDGGTAIAALGADPAVLNPAISVGVPDVFTGCILYDALIRFGQNFKIEPSLAKSWEISPDGLTYTFHLEKASFTDGQPVTSEDVKFSLMDVSSKYGPKFIAAGKFIKEIDTPDPMTVVIKLSKPFGPFLFSLACEQNAAILPEHVFKGTDVLKNPASLSQPVGEGPFMLKEWVRGDHLTFVKNPHYWRKGEPHLDQIVVKIMPDTPARVLALRAGEVDFIDEYYFPLSAYSQFSHNPNFTLQDVSYPSDDVLIINTKRQPFDKPEVRQALLMAIDRDFIHKSVFYGIGGVAVSSIDTRIKWAYNPAVNYDKMYPYDPKKAAALLDKAGVKPGSDGTRFTLHLSYDAGRPEYNALAQALQRYWKAIGVNVVLQGAERPVVLKKVYSDYDFDVTIQNYTTSGDPALGIARLYVTDSIKKGSTFNNASQYSNPEVDKLFREGQNGRTEEERAKDYFKVQEILARDLPVLTIHQQAEIDAASNRLHDVFFGANYVWWGSVWMQQ